MTPRPQRKPGLTPRQRTFLEFLRAHERSGSRFSAADIAAKVGWKVDSVRTNLSEGHWARVVVKDGKGAFRAVGVVDLSEREFHARISQSKHVQSFGHGVANGLAASLLARSRDNMILALELYNRPSLANRLDGFVMLYCAAWEQMLKSQLIERDGEEAIFEAHKLGQERRSIGLTEAISRIFSSKTPSRRNLEDIQEIRDRAVHLLVPQLQPIVARLFQAGIFNYARQFKQVTGEPFVPHTAIGLLTLVADTEAPTDVNLRAAYGLHTGDEVSALMKRLAEAIDHEESWEYAVPLKYRLVFSDKDGTADMALTKLAHDALDANTLVVVEKTRERRHTHPYLPLAAIRAIDERLRAELTAEALAARLVAVKDGVLRFTSHDFQALVAKEGWRSANNEYHHCDEEIGRRWYSHKVIDIAVHRIAEDGTYLRRARESYAAAAKTRLRKRSA